MNRTACVQALTAETVTVEADFSVTLGEFVSSAEGSWYGQVRSHNGSQVTVLSLDPTEKIHIGDELTFTEETLNSRLECTAAGTVIDPLGRFILNVSDVEGERAPTQEFRQNTGSFWGLKNLGSFMTLHEGEAVALLGAPPGGFSELFRQIVLSQRADWLCIFCQTSAIELYRYCRSAIASGCAPHTIVLWSPPWSTAVLKNLASKALTRLLALRHEAGHGLVLIDDLHSWLESVREFGESSGELLLPDGYPYTARRDFAELLDLKSSFENGSSTSLIAGWRYEEGYSPMVEHPYLARLPRFMKTGIFLDEQAEYLVPSDESWGELAPAGQCWQALKRLTNAGSEETVPALNLLKDLFGSLFIEYSPLSLIPAEDESVQFTADDCKALLALASEPVSGLYSSVQKLESELHLRFRDPSATRRRLFLTWLHSMAPKEAWA
jgi:hypothetical protein